VLFLSQTGRPLVPDELTDLARRYVKASGVGKEGACHLFRHSAATAMLDNGADIRIIQELLGHASLESTQIYTHLSIQKLREIHAATHPTAKLEQQTTLAEEEEQLLDQHHAELVSVLEGDEADEPESP
jgi:integrase/recombinase XerD